VNKEIYNEIIVLNTKKYSEEEIIKQHEKNISEINKQIDLLTKNCDHYLPNGKTSMESAGCGYDFCIICRSLI